MRSLWPDLPPSCTKAGLCSTYRVKSAEAWMCQICWRYLSRCAANNSRMTPFSWDSHKRCARPRLVPFNDVRLLKIRQIPMWLPSDRSDLLPPIKELAALMQEFDA